MIKAWFGGPLTRLFAGAAMISFSPVWVALADVSPTTSAFYRVAIGGIALTLFLLVTRQRFDLVKRAIQLLAIGAVVFAVNLWLYHRSIIAVGPGLATMLSSFQVFFMMLAGVLWLGQKPSLRQFAAVPLALVGVGMIVGFDWQSLPEDYRWGIVWGLLGAMTYAGYMLLMRGAREEARHALPIREVALLSLITAALLAGFAFAEGQSLAIPSLVDFAWLFNYGVVSHGLGVMLIASSLPKVAPAQIGIALLLQPTLSFVWDVLIFGRALGPVEIGGAVLALTAIYLGSRNRSQTA